MAGAIPAGTRVTLRYRLPPGSTHPMTDIIGELLRSDEDSVAVRARDGREVHVSRDQVVALKALGPRPIRTPRM